MNAGNLWGGVLILLFGGAIAFLALQFRQPTESELQSMRVVGNRIRDTYLRYQDPPAERGVYKTGWNATGACGKPYIDDTVAYTFSGGQTVVVTVKGNPMGKTYKITKEISPGLPPGQTDYILDLHLALIDIFRAQGWKSEK